MRCIDLFRYVCDECVSAKQGTELYCMCKQPYDEARFYIGCEVCPDWLHGRCVGQYYIISPSNIVRFFLPIVELNIK